MNKNGFLYTVIFSFLTAFVFVFVLSLVNVGTKETVAENNLVNQNRAILEALGIPYQAGNNQDILAKFAGVQTRGSGSNLYYEAVVDGQRVYALPVAGPGLWGTIQAVLGFSEKLDRITGFTVVSHSETPGLGGRVEEPWFTGQFAGQFVPDNGVLTFKQGTGAGDPDKDDTAFDAITGATRTTEGVAVIVERATQQIRGLIGGTQ